MTGIARREEAAAVSATDVVADLTRFEEAILDQLEAAGLPTDGVVVDLDERVTLLTTAGSALRHLPEAERGQAFYVSKMMVAAAVGLFDAALNYLWDETVNELRRHVLGYDLTYFYDVAVPGDLRKHFKGPDELPQVQDARLLSTCREIGLLSDVAYTQIAHVLYMRNHASAAHPHQVELTGLQLVAWLETCIRQVITLGPDEITANIKQLLGNIKDRQLDEAAVTGAACFFESLPGDRPDKLAQGLFGLYTAPDRTAIVASNVLKLWPELWEFVSEDARYQFGTKFGRFQASVETGQASAARELLDLVDGAAYLPEQTRVTEIDAAIDALVTAHNGFNNFYNEPEPARKLKELIGARGQVPVALSTKYTRAVVKAYLGNGYGLSVAALSSYREMLTALGPREASTALRSFTDPEIASVLWSSTGKKQWDKLLTLLEPKLTRRDDRTLYKAVQEFTGPPDQLRADSQIRRLAESRAHVAHLRGERSRGKS